jgi:hypothetical protein
MGKHGKPKKRPQSERRDVSRDALQAVLARAAGVLDTQDHALLVAAIDTLAFLTQELEAKGASLKRLRRLIFGASTEKTRNVLGERPAAPASPAAPVAPGGAALDSVAPGAADGTATGEPPTPKPKRPGHGRNGAASYTGAEKIVVPHESLHPGDPCPYAGCDGKVYRQAEPAVVVRVRGMAPLQATVWEKDRFRCNLCGLVFTASSPPGVGEEKYEETATAMVALLKYGAGMPFYRLDRLQKSLGIPLPAATQWELVAQGAELVEPAFDELVRQGAQGQVLHNDDTTMKVLEVDDEWRQQAAARDGEGAAASDRTGTFTSGIVSTTDGNCVALFFTGVQHAGENLADVLEKRAAELEPPIQMCDALSRNTKGDFETIVANCLAHGRRKFVDVVESFPDEVRHVLETLRDVYRNDALAQRDELSPEQRLAFHQEHSGPPMEALEKWLRTQIDQKKVEPNSGLGDAVGYMLKHWKELTLFLRVAGAPLDNSICERALKRAVLHRKNALFYKTLNGARVGDIFMSLIHTAELGSANPFEYLVALQRHHEAVARAPADWMPWNYRDTLARRAAGT